MNRVLLLGATGFLGTAVRARLGEVAEVVTAGRQPSTVDVQVDLSTAGPDRLARILREVRPDVVVNCAGCTRGGAAELVAGNVVAVSALLGGLERSGATGHPTRLVHLGSAAEYGAVTPGLPVSETDDVYPVGAYGVSKLAGTALIRAAASAGRPAVVLRVFNPLGPGTPEYLLPGRLVAAVREAGRSAAVGETAVSATYPGGVDGADRPATRVGPLIGHRDFVDIRDVAEAVMVAALSRDELPPVINIGSGRATALRELAALVSRIGGGPVVEEAGRGSPRSAEVVWQQAAIELAREALDWQPRIDLTSSVRDMWRAACVDCPSRRRVRPVNGRPGPAG